MATPPFPGRSQTFCRISPILRDLIFTALISAVMLLIKSRKFETRYNSRRSILRTSPGNSIGLRHKPLRIPFRIARFYGSRNSLLQTNLNQAETEKQRFPSQASSIVAASLLCRVKAKNCFFRRFLSPLKLGWIMHVSTCFSPAEALVGAVGRFIGWMAVE